MQTSQLQILRKNDFYAKLMKIVVLVQNYLVGSEAIIIQYTARIIEIDDTVYSQCEN